MSGRGKQQLARSSGFGHCRYMIQYENLHLDAEIDGVREDPAGQRANVCDGVAA